VNEAKNTDFHIKLHTDKTVGGTKRGALFKRKIKKKKQAKTYAYVIGHTWMIIKFSGTRSMKQGIFPRCSKFNLGLKGISRCLFSSMQ